MQALELVSEYFGALVGEETSGDAAEERVFRDSDATTGRWSETLKMRDEWVDGCMRGWVVGWVDGYPSTTGWLAGWLDGRTGR